MSVCQSVTIIFPEIEFWQTGVRPWDSPQFRHLGRIKKKLKAHLNELKSAKSGVS